MKRRLQRHAEYALPSISRLGCVAAIILVSGAVTLYITVMPIVWLAALPFEWFGSMARLGMNAYTAASATSLLGAAGATLAIRLFPSRFVHRVAPRHPNAMLVVFVVAISTVLAFLTLLEYYLHGPVSNVL